jgi:hypothetical protein
MKKQSTKNSKKPNLDEIPVSQGRHQAKCLICAHSQRDVIEAEFINWASPTKIAEEYGISRDGVYRHARAMGLIEKRRRNVRAALERIIEKGGDVEVNAAAVVAAVSAYSRINARGEWIERTETVNLNEMFNKMTAAELETYATTGVVPAWFAASSSATVADSRGDTDRG